MPEKDEEEIDEEVDKLIATLKKMEDYWDKTVDDLSKKLDCSAKEVIPVQAEVISVYQRVSENIKNMVYQLAKLMPKIKALKKQRFEYYAGALAPYPNNASERNKLIEWDVALYDRKKDILDGHIDHLRNTLKNVDNMNFTIKNKIELYKMTGLE